MGIDLSGKIAVVTGASGELGRVISRTLARAGAAVALHYYQNATKAEEIQREIAAAGGRVMTVQADVSDRASVFAMRDRVRVELGDADIIVNNAVHQYQWVSVLEQDEADYQSQFDTCVVHNLLMAKAFVPAMIEKQAGRVIATNTECTMQAGPNMSAYISGKAGQDRLLRVLAKEIGGHNITVNQVAPGWMVSDRFRADPTDDSAYAQRVPLKRRGEDQDIANAVVFLASDMARFISGCYLPVCGGNVMPAI
ncbi:MAG: SDR family oxidoreductase [Candidatus Latescibacteria bacterium]|nr:SDR family oxidoreductase [Candidatus Latescibacterota bacterium]